MGHGIEWMIAVAGWVASFPGALGRVAAFGTGALLLMSLGLVVLCLLKTPLRFVGAFLIGCAVVLMIRSPQPDILVAADGSARPVASGGCATARSSPSRGRSRRSRRTAAAPLWC